MDSTPTSYRRLRRLLDSQKSEKHADDLMWTYLHVALSCALRRAGPSQVEQEVRSRIALAQGLGHEQ